MAGIWETDFGVLTPPEYYDLFGRTRIERALNMFANNLILGMYPDPANNRVFYLFLSQTFPVTGVTNVVRWMGFMHNSECTCPDFQQRQIICKHIYCVRLNNLIAL